MFSYSAEERLPLVKQAVLIPNNNDGLAENSRAVAHLFPNVTLIDVPGLQRGSFDLHAGRLVAFSGIS